MAARRTDRAAALVPANRILDDHTPDNYTLNDHTPNDQTPDDQTPDDQTPDDQTPDDHFHHAREPKVEAHARPHWWYGGDAPRSRRRAG